MSYCWKCGTELKVDAKFCHSCGAPVTEEARRERERRKHVEWWE